MKKYFLFVLLGLCSLSGAGGANYLEYNCECGCDPDLQECFSQYQVLPECGTTFTYDCRLAGGFVGNFKMRTTPNGADATACGTCNCANRKCGLWESDENNVSSRGCNRVYERDTYTCANNFELEFGCAAGYYYQSGSSWNTVCNKCPAMTDITGIARAGIGEEGNSNGCSACVMPAGYNFKDETGIYTFVKDCQASC